MWYNYKAPTINTSLSGHAILESAQLENFINDYQANSSLYHCYYDLEKRDSFKDYAGLLKPVFDTVHIDMDSKDDGGSLAGADEGSVFEASGIWLPVSVIFFRE